MNLDQIKDRFEIKTENGDRAEILFYAKDQPYPIIGVVFINGVWTAKEWNHNGVSVYEDFDLVKVKEPLPKDIACKVWNKGGSAFSLIRYSDGQGEFKDNGTTTLINEGSTPWDHFEVMKQDPQPWFNNRECPIPEYLKFVVFRDGDWINGESTDHDSWNGSDRPITAYQIIGSI